MSNLLSWSSVVRIAAIGSLAVWTAVGISQDTFPEITPIRSSGGKLETTLTARNGHWVIGRQPVEMRSYGGRPTGPMLRVKPGDIMLIDLVNNLPEMTLPPGCQDPYWETYNTTNLHTHGLHVSPAGNSDNVLVRIEPGKRFRHEIYIPEDHPPGTFWYHSHVHGSTAIQVGSGMAGPIVVEGGLDDVPEIKQARERVILFQQTPYTVGRDGLGRLECIPPGPPPPFEATTINGRVRPRFVIRPGAVERWRFIHGGIFASLKIALRKKGESRFFPLNEIAADGFAFGDMRTRRHILMYPGYRSDVLVKAPMEKGDYELVDLESLPGEALWDQTEPENILADVRIDGDPRQMNFPHPDSLKDLVPFEPIENLTGPEQRVVFEIKDGKYMINGKVFPDGPTRRLVLDQTAKWIIAAEGSPNIAHPFHIHVNPFELKERDGKRYWKDTLSVYPGQRVEVLSRYVRYIGKFVLHCHNLIHEDRGMMQMVEMVVDAKDHGHDAPHAMDGGKKPEAGPARAKH